MMCFILSFLSFSKFLLSSLRHLEFCFFSLKFYTFSYCSISFGPFYPFIPCFVLSVLPLSELFLFTLQPFELCFCSFLFVPLPVFIISFVLSPSSHPCWSSVEGKDWSPCCARSQVTLRECDSIVCRSEWPSVQCWGRWTRSCWQPGYGNGHVNWVSPTLGSPAFSLFHTVTAYFFSLVLVLWMTWSHLRVVSEALYYDFISVMCVEWHVLRFMPV